MSLSKKLRFEVFKRDGFQCAYCGKTPPEVSLEVDHIDPKSKGGKDDINNLITACFDCNRGKSNVEINKIPQKLNENLEILKEKEEQLKEYRKFILKIRNRRKNEIIKIEKEFQKYFPNNNFTENFKTSINKFLEKLDFFTVYDAMNTSCLSMDDANQATKYFCGICWNVIRESGIK